MALTRYLLFDRLVLYYVLELVKMGILSIVLLVFFIIIAVLLILLVLIQNEDGNHLGGIFAGGSDSAFGSRSGNVLTRATTVLGSLFLIVSLGLALLSRTPGGSGVEEEGRRQAAEGMRTNWVEEELNPSPPVIDEIFFDGILPEDAQGF